MITSKPTSRSHSHTQYTHSLNLEPDAKFSTKTMMKVPKQSPASIKSTRDPRIDLSGGVPQRLKPQFLISSRVTFAIFSISNVLAALYAPIQDCDEVFNYWEPTHYLNHRFGLQTWEYAPEFSIRSWLYIAIHAILGKFASLLFSKKTIEFYAIRLLLGMACAGSETRLFASISRSLNPRIGIMFMIAMIFSPGMFHASVAYLPSSFSMYAAMLGMAAFMDWRGGLKTSEGIMWFGIGAIVGWPFSAALIVPLLMGDVFLAKDRSETAFQYADGIKRCLIVLVSSYIHPYPSEENLLILFRRCKSALIHSSIARLWLCLGAL